MDKALAEEDKKLTYLCIRNTILYKQNVLVGNKMTAEQRKNIINNIAIVRLSQDMLKKDAGYAETIKNHNQNVAYLKKELNITEQEIQTEINKLEAERKTIFTDEEIKK